uniref:(northern house mosquito) hypothetical protein n=1 Tax=Culex pipiens TaxID=7175 RepID=A0A8D8DBA2_CULPI
MFTLVFSVLTHQSKIKIRLPNCAQSLLIRIHLSDSVFAAELLRAARADDAASVSGNAPARRDDRNHTRAIVPDAAVDKFGYHHVPVVPCTAARQPRKCTMKKKLGVSFEIKRYRIYVFYVKIQVKAR